MMGSCVAVCVGGWFRGGWGAATGHRPSSASRCGVTGAGAGAETSCWSPRPGRRGGGGAGLVSSGVLGRDRPRLEPQLDSSPARRLLK